MAYSLCMSSTLRGVRVIVAGAGLSGLSAAYDLEREGAEVALFDARDRVGGRVWTIRDGFADHQHAEAGADLIEGEQSRVLDLARDLGLETTRILRRGFGYYGPDARGRRTIQSRTATFERFRERLRPLIEQYRLGEERWDNAIAATFGRISVAEWLRAERGDRWLTARFRALRGLFLADPEELSLVAVIDFFNQSESGPETMMRIVDGNDRLATGLARRLTSPPVLRTALVRVRHTGRSVTATVAIDGRRVERRADYLICTLPAGNVRKVEFEPGLPDEQRRAYDTLRMGPATRALLQFDRRFWRRRGRPSAFGSPFAFGAVWDGNEQQRGRAGILSLLAGGGASAELQALLARGGMARVVRGLSWLGDGGGLLASRVITWEGDPWARGGYAVFNTSFRPGERDVLARPAGRVFFAGEHTSVRWQGYMNGAIETGRRAAAEVAAAHAALV